MQQALINKIYYITGITTHLFWTCLRLLKKSIKPLYILNPSNVHFVQSTLSYSLNFWIIYALFSNYQFYKILKMSLIQRLIYSSSCTQYWTPNPKVTKCIKNWFFSTCTRFDEEMRYLNFMTLLFICLKGLDGAPPFDLSKFIWQLFIRR